MVETRTEVDSLGSAELPTDVLYGLATHRASANFDISSNKIGRHPELLRALARIKRAAAEANQTLGMIPAGVAAAIATVAMEIEQGLHAEAFVVDMMEGSGGTSINMNINEVLANRATQILGSKTDGHTRVHPNDHVNAGQSTNDVIPAAIKLAVFEKSDALLSVLKQLGAAFAGRGQDFRGVLRVGRTCLQAGQPMYLNQVFGGYASAIGRQADAIAELRRSMLILPLGGTAVGTGLGSAQGFEEHIYGRLRAITGEAVRSGDDIFDAMQNADAFSRFSAGLRVCAEVIGKIAADLIILSSDPGAGIGELRLPTVQPGSSIMPGKVNPVLPMMVQQVAFSVIGNDSAISLACLHGQLEINHFEPLIAAKLFESLDLMSRAYLIFAEKCVEGIEADHDRSLENLLRSPAISTAFVKMLGYDAVSDLVKVSREERRPFVDVAIDRGLLTRDAVLEIVRQSAGGRITNGNNTLATR